MILNSRDFLFVARSAIACLSIVAVAHATNFDDTANWDGASEIGNLSAGPESSIQTVGETFIAPVGTTVLNSFTFYAGDSDSDLQDYLGNLIPDESHDSYTLQAQVFNWTGPLDAGTPGGAALFTSGPFLFDPDLGYSPVTVDLGSGLNLVAGGDYVMDLSYVSGPSFAGPGYDEDALASGIKTL
jgi:hypothetical protein